MRQLKIEKQRTDRNYVCTDQYLHEIGALSLLTPEEELLLIRQIRNGNRKAIETLMNANLRLVVAVAKRYQNGGLTLTDLIIEGNLGLLKAAECFDETRGFEFITYAIWCIRQSIIGSIVENLSIRQIPLNKNGLLSEFRNTFTKLEEYYRREPGAEELAGMLEFQAGIVDETIQAHNNHQSGNGLET